MMKLAFAFLYLVRLLPYCLIRRLANVLGWVLYYLISNRRRIGRINLALCFPEKTQAERDRILKQNFQHMTSMILEYGICWYSSAERIDKLVTYKNKHYLDEALAQGHKIILLYPHFCAFEMGVFKLNQTQPLLSIYSKQKNPIMDKKMYDSRQRYHNAHIVPRTAGLLAMIKTIKATDAPFLYLPDQDFGPKDSIFVDFMGVNTATTPGLSRIGKLTNAKIIPMITNRMNTGFELEFFPEWTDFPSDNAEADTLRMNQFIGEQARRLPEQYFWLHKRFKTRPEGEKGFY